MPPQVNDMSGVEECFGRHWDPTSAICVGGADHSQGGLRKPGCSCEKACKTMLAHAQAALIPIRRLSEDRTRTTQIVPTPPPAAVQAPRPIQPNYPPPQVYAQPAPPPQHPPAYAPPPYQQHPQGHMQPAPHQAAAHPHHGGYPSTMGPVHFNPVATVAPSFLTATESRKQGKRVGSFVSEILRAAAKGGAMQAASFFDGVPFGWEDHDK